MSFMARASFRESRIHLGLPSLAFFAATALILSSPAVEAHTSPSAGASLSDTLAAGAIPLADTKTPRPKIGLALSGGGARTFAHIGVIKVLEELRIPVDFIAGTSGGALIGGLYASGLTAAEIEAAVLTVDWDDLFSDSPERRDLSFRRKQDERSDLFDFEIGFQGIIPTLPPGVITGQKLALALKFPQIQTTTRLDFDSLAIPYRAVATDMETGEMVVLSSGGLVHAIRASISVPGVFTPVRMGGRLLVDGGLVRNVPVDIVEHMGADIIITSDVSDPLDAARDEDILSMFDVAKGAIKILVWNNSRGVLSRSDVIVSVDLDGYTGADFKKAQAIVRRGEASAREISDALGRYSVPEAEYRAIMEQHRQSQPAPPVIDGIELVNETRVPDRAIEDRLTVEPRGALDVERLDQLDRDLGRLYGLGLFELVDFSIVDRTSHAALRIHVTEKAYGPTIMKLGWEYVDDLEGHNDFGILARVTRLEVNRLGGEWRTDMRVGGSRGIATELYQPLVPSRTFFLAPRIGIGYAVQDIYQGTVSVAQYRIREPFAQLDAGVQFGYWAELRLGVRTGKLDTVVETGRADTPVVDKTRTGWTGRFAYDLLDDPKYPTRGGSGLVKLFLARSALGGADDFDKLSLDLTHFASFGKNTTFLAVAGGSSAGTDLPFEEQFVFGGPQSFSGLRPGQERGDAFGVARVGYYRPIAEGVVVIGTTFYVGGTLETGNIWASSDEASLDDLRYAGSLFLGATSIIGPIHIGYGRASDENDTFFLTVGRMFGNYSLRPGW
jgi:NTE family protein